VWQIKRCPSIQINKGENSEVAYWSIYKGFDFDMKYNIYYILLDPNKPLLLDHVEEKDKSNQTARMLFI
jgi:hypothetical protein